MCDVTLSPYQKSSSCAISKVTFFRKCRMVSTYGAFVLEWWTKWWWFFVLPVVCTKSPCLIESYGLMSTWVDTCGSLTGLMIFCFSLDVYNSDKVSCNETKSTIPLGRCWNEIAMLHWIGVETGSWRCTGVEMKSWRCTGSGSHYLESKVVGAQLGAFGNDCLIWLRDCAPQPVLIC